MCKYKQCTVSEKATQTMYESSYLSTEIEEMIYRNKTVFEDQHEEVSKNEKHNFRKNNSMDQEIIFLGRSKYKYFTGLYPDEFDVLFDFLGQAKYNLNCWNPTAQKKVKSLKLSSNKLFTQKQQLFVTLMRLRRGFNMYTLSHFYSVSEFCIRKVFTTWIMFLYHNFKDLKDLMFPDRQAFNI